MIYNNYERGKDNVRAVIVSTSQLNISQTAIAFNSVTVLIVSYGDLYAYHTRFTSSRAEYEIVPPSIHLKFFKFERNVINATLIYISEDKWYKFSYDSSAIEDMTVSRNIIEEDVINSNSEIQFKSTQIEGLKAFNNSFWSYISVLTFQY